MPDLLPVTYCMPSRMPPPTATPIAAVICCDAAEIAVAWLASFSSMSAKISALAEVKNRERRKPAPISTAMITPCGVSGVNSAFAAMKHPDSAAAPRSTLRNPPARSVNGARNFIASAPKADAKVSMPDWKGVMPKPSWKSSGSRNGVAPAPMRKIEPPVMATRNT